MCLYENKKKNMKNCFLLFLSLTIGFSAFAQQRVAKNDIHQATVSVNQPIYGKEVATASAAQYAPQTAKSVVVNRFQDLEEATTMWTTYDLQSNSYCSNRMYQTPNGSVGVAATMSHQYNQTASDRGTGYNFYNGSYWQNQPNNRIEDFKTGWPTIAQYGSNGEILICHGNSHLQCYTRSVAGQGQWVYKGNLPDYPSGYPYAGANDAYPTWARVVTSGNNHNIIHVVACIQHSISSDESVHHQVYFRSTDAINWTISYGPLASHGYETGAFSADNYALAANGHTVAILYSGCLTNSVWMFKSTDDGLTWNTTKVWEDPYEGADWNDPNFWFEDTLFKPMNGSIVIDNHGVTHVALNVFEMARLEGQDPGYYTHWSGRQVDGIIYWNDTQGPLTDTNHDEYIGTVYEEHFATPHQAHAARLWWPVPDDPGYVHMIPDSTKWIGFIPMYEGYDWDNDKFYSGNDYSPRFYGASGHPALAVDPHGNLACAYSTPCTKQENETDPYYKRHIYVSYRNVDKGYWEQIVDDITDPEEIFELSGSENTFTMSAPNSVNPGEYWFGFQSDQEVGLYWGSNASQTSGTDNGISVVKVIADPDMVSVPESTEAVDVIYGIYPNPATDYVIVKSAMDAEANISIFNLVGQCVKSFSKSLKLGENAISIDLQSGIYFCNIEANGFTKTIKFVVK